MTLRAAVVVRAGDFELDARVEVDSGETVAVVGPNGAGKTTLLRALAGLVALAAGRVEVDGAVLEDTTRRVRVPPERRPVGVVFQDYVLFPHLSAIDNVAYGLRRRGVRRGAARTKAAAWLDRVGASGVASSRPASLSGGEAQRVALARALAPEPHLLLLDEPLAAVDAAGRSRLRSELRRHLVGHRGARLLVTHDPVDGAVLADRVVVLEAGRVTQSGTVAEVAARPRSPWVADLVGVNLYRGRAASGRVHVAGSEAALVVASPADGEVFAAFHPRAVTLHLHQPEGSARNAFPGRVTAVDREGSRARVTIDGPLAVVAEVTPAALDELGLGEGTPVWASVKATEIDVYT